MSAFVISEEAMHKCVAALTYQGKYGYALSRFENIPMPLWDKSELGRKLYVLNTSAVEQRYGDQETIPYYKFKDHPGRDLVAGIKALNCLHYQCTEGDVPDTDTYKELERAIGVLCMEVVMNSSAWEKAPWG